MKAQLRDYVQVAGSSTRHVELDRIDWTRRVVWLPDGRWVPFEMVSSGDADKMEAARELHEKGWIDDDVLDRVKAKVTEERTAYVCACGKPFESRQALGGHARSCKAR
jgi:hypothetical protein